MRIVSLFDNCILIVLFNKEIFDSKTFHAILNAKESLNNTQIVLWNNGLLAISEYEKNKIKQLAMNIKLHESLSNISLSVIYNRFVSGYKSNKYIIMDDDSEPNKDYFAKVSSSCNSGLLIPTIEAGGEVTGPIVNGRIAKLGMLSEGDKVQAIASGLVISATIVALLKSKYGRVFDEHFYFYGVDTSFFHRFNKLKLGAKVEVFKGFNHSLSRLETESDEVTLFRVKERSYGLGLELRYYPTWVKLKTFFIILFKRVYKTNEYVSLTFILRAIVSGKHYKN